MTEVWRPIPKFEDRYRISSLGNIMSLARVVSLGSGHMAKIPVADHLIKRTWTRGELKATLYLDGKKNAQYFSIARLVATVFICECPHDSGVALTIDRDPMNCAAENLTWVPRSYLLAINTGRTPVPSLEHWIKLYSYRAP